VSDDDRPPGWPKGVNRIRVDDLGRIGIDDENRLYWDGKRVSVRQTVILHGIEKFLAVVVATFAVLGGLGGFVSGLNNASIFLCARGIHWMSCPLPESSPPPSPTPSAGPPAQTPSNLTESKPK
jgi:hypothetical protein